MPAVECPRCAANLRDGTRWHATGHTFTSTRGIRRAELVCDACGQRFTSAAPAALEAAAGVEPERTPAPVVPAPGLFPAEDRPSRSQGFVSVGELARRRIAAQKRQERRTATGGHR